MRIFTITIILLLFVSCDSISYIQDRNSTPYKIDYRKGEWLLNEIDAPVSIKDQMAKITLKEFSKHLGNSIHYLGNDGTLALSYVPMNPDSLQLRHLKKESKGDFIINIKASVIKNDYKNITTMTFLEIYDLNTLDIIYSSKVTGKHETSDTDSRDVVFSKGANGIMISSLKRILKKLNK
ncbi:hypothetical protein [Yeosuana sp. AK3]